MNARELMLWGARVAKVLALLFFFMPWLVVSCNGDPLAQATGYQLATGTIELPEMAVSPEGQERAWWALAAMIVIGLGLVFGFVMRPARRSALVMFATAGIALALVFGGMTQMVGSMRGEIEGRIGESAAATDENALTRQLSGFMRNMVNIEIEEQPGYWLTLSALLAAVAASGAGLVLSRRDGAQVMGALEERR